MTVKIDETKMTLRKYNVGRVSYTHMTPTWLVDGICRETAEVCMERVVRRDAVTLTDLVVRHV